MENTQSEQKTIIIEYEGRVLRMGKDSYGMTIRKKAAIDNKLETGKRYFVRLELKELV